MIKKSFPFEEFLLRLRYLLLDQPCSVSSIYNFIYLAHSGTGNLRKWIFFILSTDKVLFQFETFQVLFRFAAY